MFIAVHYRLILYTHAPEDARFKVADEFEGVQDCMADVANVMYELRVLTYIITIYNGTSSLLGYYTVNHKKVAVPVSYTHLTLPTKRIV